MIVVVDLAALLQCLCVSEMTHWSDPAVMAVWSVTCQWFVYREQVCVLYW